ncbi:MAG: hypothetical protein GY765_32605, partial [bacterium]|nr:hypothetical protein [bacterium]
MENKSVADVFGLRKTAMQRRTPALLFLLLFLIIRFPPLVSAFNMDLTQYRHESWGIEDGLPQSTVYSVTQTRDGYLWMATQEGLVRFDGVEFEVFDIHRVEQMAGNYISVLYEDHEGYLWFGNDIGGLLRMKNGNFKRFRDRDGLINRQITAIHHDSEGKLWIGTAGGLGLLQDGKIKTRKSLDGVPCINIRTMHKDKRGNLWIGTETGLLCMKDGKLTHYTTGDGLPVELINSIHRDDDGTLWIGTETNLVSLKNGKIQTYDSSRGLSSNHIKSLYRDNKGILWIGTSGGGLNCMENGKISTYKPPHGPPFLIIWDILQDREGNIWIGTGSRGIHCLKTGKFKTFDTQHGLASDHISVIYEDRAKTLWFGTKGGLTRLKDGVFQTLFSREGSKRNDIKGIHQDRKNRLWFGTFGGLISIIDGKVKTYFNLNSMNNRVSAILEDKRGNLWIGMTDGLYRFKNGELTAFKSPHIPGNEPIRAIHQDSKDFLWIGTGNGLVRMKNGQSKVFDTHRPYSTNNLVKSIYEDREGALWFGTRGGGLDRFKNGIFTNINAGNGLFKDTIHVLLEDDRGTFWMSCNKGIFSVPKKQLDDFCDGKRKAVHCRVYSEKDGMKSRECNGGNQPAGCKTQNGKLWFPTLQGAVMIDPGNIERNPLPPPVIIEKITTDGTEITILSTTPRITVKPGMERFEFKYTGLSFQVPERVRFKCILEGFEDHWRDVGTRRTAAYTKLPPGEYTFRVTACNNDGVWNESGASVSFYVQPLFFQTNWFDFLCILAGALMVFFLFRLRVRRLKLREIELKNLVDQQTTTLKEQYNELEAIDRVVKTINREVHLEKLLESLLKQAMDLFPRAEAGFFLIYDKNKNAFIATAVEGMNVDLRKNLSISYDGAVH